ncbi:hypothetical protein [Brachyspira hampsonii]|uniref:Uncharacterized protein n=1 Tax=Brachyspira hampsonii 30446 TaxID=1289135 RepID=A0A2U4F4Z7_9SPIR|nr:hypothetical protein [Brachyspira hampsonii]EKV57737.1 hypothetical protein A966_04080 [Brachyspira hampsonii 30446]MBW5390801.1 hypothetical protein [Brachyspira hampsonii]MBW5394613.1 hypothetical protein [Brachyspira hampsonii]OEJ18507.1 hypothetical protein A9495_06035 [Brachyspira hampsonii]PTY41150.1 hypothetical protein DQ06_11670 [Brachyspira hampsonii bv. II]
MDYGNVRLYEIASMLSPSVYETIFYSQYQGRSDKDALILDDETFERCHVSDNVYKNFLFSNAARLGKSIDYVGLNQMHSAVIEDMKITENDISVKLNDIILTNLANTLIDIKSMDVRLEPFYITLLFKGINYYSNNYIDENEKLIPIDESPVNSIYRQDQLSFINDKHIDIVISTQYIDNKLKYIIINCSNIEVVESAKDTWKNIFKNDFSMLYEYFQNIRKSSNLIIEGTVYKTIISGYEKFMDDFIDLDDF